MRSFFDDASLAEPDDLLRKELASRTLSLLSHVHATNAISEATLNTLCSDIVQSLRDSECSEVELAYSLLILGMHFILSFLGIFLFTCVLSYRLNVYVHYSFSLLLCYSLL